MKIRDVIKARITAIKEKANNDVAALQVYLDMNESWLNAEADAFKATFQSLLEKLKNG